MLFFFNVLLNNCYGQTVNRKYDLFKDTLLVISDTLIHYDKVHFEREFLLGIDSVAVNQKGIFVESFTMSALSLGHSASLKSTGGKITDAMKNNLIREQNKFKFIYIKDIILQTRDGRKYSPSTKSIKIVFIN